MKLFFARLVPFVVICSASVSFGQSVSLSLPQTVIPPGGAVTIDIRMAGGAQPASVQWSLAFADSDFAFASITPGAAATAAGKTLACHGAAGAQTCAVSGLNLNGIGDGVLATASFTLASGGGLVRPLQLAGLAASAAGELVPTTAENGSVTIVVPPVVPTQLTCSPGSLVAPGTSNCTITLSGFAPAGGIAATLASSVTAAAVPATVAIPAGSSSATFPVSVGTLTADSSATLTAAVNGGSVSATLAFIAPPQLSSFVCSPSSITGPAPLNCAVVLTKAALTGGATVSIASSSTSLTAPTQLIVPAGSASASMAVAAGAVTADQTAAITASLNGSVRSAAVTLLVPGVSCPCSLWAPSNTPANLADSDTAAVELGMKFRSSAAGYVLGVRFYKGAGNTGTHTGSLWNKAGKRLATIKFTGETASGWQQANFTAPVHISPNETYTISYRAPRGRYSYNQYFFSGPGVENGPLRALREGEDGGNGVYRYGASAFPSSSYVASNYWVDIVFNTLPSATPAVVPKAAELSLISRLSAVDEAMPEATELSVPDEIFATPGERVSFRAAITDRGGRLASAIPAGLPENATFDAASSRFDWTPSSRQAGEHEIAFDAAGSLGRTRIVVGAGLPDIARDSDSACTAGATATLRGQWLSLSGEEQEDFSGSSEELAGTRVRVNGLLAPVLAVSPGRVEFQCPSAPPGTALTIVVETPFAQSRPHDSVIREAHASGSR